MKRIIINTVALVAIILPFVAFSQTIENPLKDVTSVEGFVSQLLSVVFKIGSVLSILFIIYSGYLFVQARGNPGALGKAKDTLVGTLIGVALLLGATLIAQIVIGTINAIR
jgi:hypothetical protein